MNRRELLQTLAALPVAAAVPLPVDPVAALLAKAAAGDLGPVDVWGHRRLVEDFGVFFLVTVNGTDVTNRCYYADDRAGLVRCFRHNGKGQCYYDRARDEAAREVLRGRVRFVPRAA
jgi:uncharacterized ParB-like nuclease family protein